MKWPAPLQVPSVWRPVTEDPATLQLFLDYYAASAPPLSKHALECLVCCQPPESALASNLVLCSWPACPLNLPQPATQFHGPGQPVPQTVERENRRAPQHGAWLLSCSQWRRDG